MSFKPAWVTGWMRILAIVAFFHVALVTPSEAQQEPPFSDLGPLLAGGEREEIPWRITLSKAHFSFEQRLQVVVEVVVRGKDLLKKGEKHDLELYVWVGDSASGESLGNGTFRVFAHTEMPRRGQARISPDRELVFTFPILASPGDYKLGLVLLDRTTGTRSVGEKSLRIRAPRKDPIPQSLARSPRVEIAAPGEGPDLHYAPSIGQTLWLPVRTEKLIQLDILVNCCAPADVLPALKALSQIKLRRGSIQIRLLDLAGDRVIFQQRLDHSQLDWATVRTILTDNEMPLSSWEEHFTRNPDSGAIVDAMAETHKQCLEGCAPNHARVIVVLSRPTEFQNRVKDFMGKCPSCRCQTKVYYLKFLTQRPDLFLWSADRYEFFWSGDKYEPRPQLDLLDELDQQRDGIPKILKPFRPRVFAIMKPMDLRKALAFILNDIDGL